MSHFLHTYPQITPREQCLELTPIEWQQIKYLTNLTGFFNLYTQALSSGGPQLHNVFSVFNDLFDIHDVLKEHLESKSELWKHDLAWAVKCSQEKLAAYYDLTCGNLGNLLAIACALDPQHKLAGYCDPCWDDDDGND